MLAQNMQKLRPYFYGPYTVLSRTNYGWKRPLTAVRTTWWNPLRLFSAGHITSLAHRPSPSALACRPSPIAASLCPKAPNCSAQHPPWTDLTRRRSVSDGSVVAPRYSVPIDIKYFVVVVVAGAVALLNVPHSHQLVTVLMCRPSCVFLPLYC